MITSSRLFKMPELCAWCGGHPAPYRRRVRWRIHHQAARHDVLLKLPVCARCRLYRRTLRLRMGGVLGLFAGLMLWTDFYFYQITRDAIGLLFGLMMQVLVLWIMHHPLRTILLAALKRSRIEPPGYLEQVGAVSFLEGGDGAEVEIVFHQPEFYKQFVRLNEDPLEEPV